MAGRIDDMLCEARDLAKKCADYYAEAAAACDGGPGKEVFGYLKEEEDKLAARVEEIYEAVSKGESFAGACKMPEEGDPIQGMVKSVAEKYSPAGSCASELSATRAGLELAKKAVDFYGSWLAKAEGDVEKEFATKVQAEERGNVMILTDLELYYADPQGWALKSDDQILDGA